MILIYTNKPVVFAAAVVAALSGCGSNEGTSSAGTQVQFAVTPAAINSPAMAAGSKTFTSADSHSITLTSAYLNIASVTLETSCTMTFSALLHELVNTLLPTAFAHTSSTPTSTGIPNVINILAVDDMPVSVGALSPPAANYCGATLDLLAADADTVNLPTGQGIPNNMVGSSVYLTANYTLSGGGNGAFTINTSIALAPRELLFAMPFALSASNLNVSKSFAINYDTWFNGVDLSVLEAGSADINYGAQLTQLLHNITASIHER